jgi:anti-sigma regulatory factor (Ser/Thr protein kinase)
MRATARPLSQPAPWAVPRSRSSGNARSATGGQLRLCALPSAPFWARQYTRLFLAECPGISDDATETAQLIVSELVTNAARAAASTLGVIGLSLRPVRNELIIEVRDQSAEPPVLAPANDEAEHGRGLMLVDALSEEWGYSDEPHGGKVVYAIVRLALANFEGASRIGRWLADAVEVFHG